MGCEITFVGTVTHESVRTEAARTEKNQGVKGTQTLITISESTTSKSSSILITDCHWMVYTVTSSWNAPIKNLKNNFLIVSMSSHVWYLSNYLKVFDSCRYIGCRSPHCTGRKVFQNVPGKVTGGVVPFVSLDVVSIKTYVVQKCELERWELWG